MRKLHFARDRGFVIMALGFLEKAKLPCRCAIVFRPRRTILADTSRGFRYRTSVPNIDKLAEFVAWCQSHIAGDEKGQAQIFLDCPCEGNWQERKLPVRSCLEIQRSVSSVPIALFYFSRSLYN